MNVLEELLLEPNVDEIEKLASGASSEPEKEVFNLAAATLKAKFEEILENPTVNPIVKDLDFESAGVFEELAKRIQKFLKVDESGVSEEEHQRNQTIVLLVGITYLSLYVQINFTGPSLPAYFKEVSPETKKRLIADLARNGENAYHKARYPHYLLSAVTILVDQFPNLDRLKTACWWNARCLFIHQKTLFQKVPSLKHSIQQQFEIVSRVFSARPENNQFDSESSRARELGAKASLELGLVHHYYRSIKKAQDAFQLAQDWSGLSSNLTGMLGRRTRFQTFDNAQLVLEASSSKRDEMEQEKEKKERESKPREVHNEDPTVLPSPALVTPVSEDNLRVIDQAILLALCLNVKNQNPGHGLTTEEMAPYVRRVQAHPNNWLVYTLGLLLKSRLESESSKTIERAALQFQVLVEQFEDETAAADVRLKYFFEIPFPSVWDLKQEVGERLMAIGAAASALTIFEDLEIWEKIIDCYKIMSRGGKAEELVRERLAIAPTPEMWCVLGDLTNNTEHYMTAWELSGKHYARAMRSLARASLATKDYAKCVEYYTLALAINPLFPGSWFSLGCAAMQIQLFDVALNAFSRVVSLEPEEGEAWANMASIYLAQNKMNEAFVSLQEGLKHRRDNWKMWQNFMSICLEIGEFQQGVYCMHKLLELREKETDVKVLRVLTRIVLQNVADRYGEPGEKLQKPVVELFGRVTSKIATNPEIWQVYASLHGGLGNKDKELDCLQKAVRASETAGWERDEKLFERVAIMNSSLAFAHLSSNDPKNIYSAKLKLRSLVKKTEDSFRQTEAHKKLVELLKEVEDKEKALSQ